MREVSKRIRENREKNTWTKKEIMHSIAEFMDINKVVENIKK